MTKTFSLLRRLQYNHMSHITLSGRILDIGGDRNSGYHELICGAHTIEVSNIKTQAGVDFIFDAQKTFPIEDQSYDGVIMLNVLEHLFGYQNAVSESFRILKPGGTLIGSTPFLFNVHGSPDDFFRYTHSALQQIFKTAGFVDIQITPLGSGAFSVLYHILFGLYRFDFVKECMLRAVVFLDAIVNRIKKDNHLSVQYMPLGYFFEVRKP